MFLASQEILGEKALLQLLIDMKVRWSSTYIMLCQAESRMEVSFYRANIILATEHYTRPSQSTGSFPT